MTQVALINPPYGVRGQSMRPLGLVALGAHLEHNLPKPHEVRVFDFSDANEKELTLLEDSFVRHSDVVGFSAYSSNFLIAVEWAKHVRRTRTQHSQKTVIGGHHASETVPDILKRYSDVFDFVVAGEGEIPLERLVRSLQAGHQDLTGINGVHSRERRGPKEFKADLIRDLDDLAVPLASITSPYARELTFFDKREGRARRAIALVSSRGCPFGCDFCTLRRQKWRALSIPRLLEWIDALSVAAGTMIEHIYFMDALLFTRPDRVLAIAEALRERFPKVTWSGSARSDQIVRLATDLPALANAGLRFVEIGVESGSEAALRRYNKGTTVEQNVLAISLLKAANIDIALDFIMFYPDQTVNDIEENLKFLHRTNLTELLPHDHFYTYLTPYPGTPSRVHYETIFNTKFPVDSLPDPDEYFMDGASRNLFKLFVRDFESFRRRLTSLIRYLELSLQSAMPRSSLAQRLRLEAVTLRHVPFMVLRDLCKAPQSEGLLDAVPWLADFDRYETELRKICSPLQIKGSQPYADAAGTVLSH